MNLEELAQHGRNPGRFEGRGTGLSLEDEDGRQEQEPHGRLQDRLGALEQESEDRQSLPDDAQEHEQRNGQHDGSSVSACSATSR